ncbi:TonB-dependent receptor [Hymenobacter terrigena]
MKKRIYWLSLALVAGQAGHAFAQDATDALRYSRLQFGGTARTQAIGGANVALGADFGNLTSNPAGLGLFQKSEVHLTPGIGIGQADSRVDGGSGAAQNDTKNSFHIGSVGAVFASRRPDDDQTTNWRGGAFALGFTRLADFNTALQYGNTLDTRTSGGYTLTGDDQSYLASLRRTVGYNGYTQANIDRLRAQGQSGDYTSLNGLAYGAYLTTIAKDRNGNDIGVASTTRKGPIGQAESVISKGSVSQFDLGYGANYRDRLYLGIGVGIVSSNFTQTRNYTETETDATTHLSDYTLHDELKTNGTGINARLGAIYRATDALRFGASIQTPTFMRMTDTYNAAFTTTFTAQGNDVVATSLPTGPVGVKVLDQEFPLYAYTITTPFRANGGVAYTIGKHGFVTGDVEYVGYSQARLHNDAQNSNGDDYSFTVENSDIQARYRNTVNLRFGAEGRFDIFRVRAGYARYGDPYKIDNSNERAQNFYTLGAGLRQGNFFLDLAGVYMSYNQYYTPYDLGGDEPLVKVDNSRFTTSITAGFTF